MARGIISTILGGVAGGFEGLAADQKRMRERADREREREEERRRMEAQFAFQAALSGATPGARLRTDEAAVAEQRLRDTPVSRVMDQAPLFEEPSEAPVGRSALDAALQARMPRPDFAAERPATTRVTPVTEEEDYFQLTSPGGQVFSMMTPEAAERRRRQQAQESAESEAAATEEAERARFQQLIDMGATRAQAMEAVYGVRQDRPESGQSRPTSRMQEFDYLVNVLGVSPEEARASVGWSEKDSSPGEQAFMEAVQRFSNQRGVGLGNMPGDFPSEREIREHALRIAPSYGLSKDFVEQLLPSAAPRGQSFFDRFATPRLESSGVRRTQPAARSETEIDWSKLSDEELERIARGGR